MGSLGKAPGLGSVAKPCDAEQIYRAEANYLHKFFVVLWISLLDEQRMQKVQKTYEGCLPVSGCTNHTQ